VFVNEKRQASSQTTDAPVIAILRYRLLAETASELAESNSDVQNSIEISKHQNPSIKTLAVMCNNYVQASKTEQ
jgi:hypothetical protein